MQVSPVVISTEALWHRKQGEGSRGKCLSNFEGGGAVPLQLLFCGSVLVKL